MNETQNGHLFRTLTIFLRFNYVFAPPSKINCENRPMMLWMHIICQSYTLTLRPPQPISAGTMAIFGCELSKYCKGTDGHGRRQFRGLVLINMFGLFESLYFVVQQNTGDKVIIW